MSNPLENRFWQINVGHILTILTTMVTLGAMYGQVSTRLETNQRDIITLQQEENRLDATVSTMQVADSAAAQDRVDLHKTIEDDFSRRLAKLEDRIENKQQ